MKAESHGQAELALGPVVRARIFYNRVRQFFALPGCYRGVRALEDCTRSRFGLARDLLVLFFSYKTFPDHYGISKLWKVPESEWKYYYGQSYHPHQRARLALSVRQRRYGMVFADKFLCGAYCRGLDIRTPYVYGIIDPLEDYKSQILSWFQAKPVQSLVIKPLYGRGGKGIVVVEKSGDSLLVRSAEGTSSFDTFELKRRAIVQDLLKQDPRMAVFSAVSVNTVRLITMLTRHGEVLSISALMRTGVGSSFVDNWCAGGVGIGVDRRTGELHPYGYDKHSIQHERHPTTGVFFAGKTFPEWDRVLRFASKVQKAFPFNRLIGQDIALDENGQPVLLEINGAPDLVAMEQTSGPILRHAAILRAFGEYGLLVNKHQKRLYANLRDNDSAGRAGG